MSKKKIVETNKERIVRELKQMGYDIKRSAEQAVSDFVHKPDNKLSFDNTETLSYFNNGEVNISLTGIDILSQQAIEASLTTYAQAIESEVHMCLKGVVNEYTK